MVWYIPPLRYVIEAEGCGRADVPTKTSALTGNSHGSGLQMQELVMAQSPSRTFMLMSTMDAFRPASGVGIALGIARDGDQRRSSGDCAVRVALTRALVRSLASTVPRNA